MTFKHISVLLNEVLENFSGLSEGSVIVDGTLGKGGHSKLLLEKGFNVIGIDRDADAIEEAGRNLKEFVSSGQMRIVQGNFSDVCDILKELRVEEVDGILLDLGVSTYQLESGERGFGFEGELDMRMDRRQKLSAKDVVNNYSEKELMEVLYKYGERVYARQIAEGIVRFREDGDEGGEGCGDGEGEVGGEGDGVGNKIETGEELLEIVKDSVSEGYRKSRKHHWASPTFRALRMEVNNDLGVIEKFLDVFVKCLKKGGVLEVITFHTMEDSIVRRKLRRLKEAKVIKLVTKRGILAKTKEVRENPKAERAQLWVGVKR